MAAPGVPAAPAPSPQPAGTEAVADELGVGQMPGRDVARVSAQGGVRRAGAGAAEDAVDSEAVEVKLEVGAASGWAADVEDPCAKPTGVVEATSSTRACARPKALACAAAAAALVGAAAAALLFALPGSIFGDDGPATEMTLHVTGHSVDDGETTTLIQEMYSGRDNFKIMISDDSQNLTWGQFSMNVTRFVSQLPAATDGGFRGAVLINEESDGIQVGHHRFRALVCDSEGSAQHNCEFVESLPADNSTGGGRNLMDDNEMIVYTTGIGVIGAVTVVCIVGMCGGPVTVAAAGVTVAASCFPSSAMVLTPGGAQSIKSVAIGALLLTSQGYAPVFLHGHQDGAAYTQMVRLVTGSNHTLTLTDAPGPYVIVHSGTVVKPTASGDAGDAVVARLGYGALVAVLEVATLEKQRRVRGRIDSPPGWISLQSLEDGHRWAKPCGALGAGRPPSPGPGRPPAPGPGSPAGAVPQTAGGWRPASGIAAKAWDGDGVPLAESNCAGIGGPEDRAARKAAAASEPAWAGAGAQLGVQIWRIEQFKVVPCDHKQFGKFHKGDSYIILETYGEEGSAKLLHHIYFWLGESTSVDEMGTAAYKTVELDDYLDGEPTQSREVMGQESLQFKALFPRLTYLDGGVETGFHHTGSVPYMPRLLHIRKTRHGVVKKEVTLSRESLNQGDCFVLDAGTLIYVWIGSEANGVEKYEANLLVDHLKLERHGRASKARCDDEFWRLLGGPGPIKSASEASDEIPEPEIGEGVLYRMLSTGGELRLEEVGRQDIHPSQLDSGHVMILDHTSELCVWVGKGAPDLESRNALSTAARFLAMNGRDRGIPIHVYKEGTPIANPLWGDVFRD